MIPQLEQLKVRTLSAPIGGLDQRTQPTQLDGAYTPKIQNFWIDEDGTIRKRLGFTTLGYNLPLPGDGMDVYVYEDEAGNQHLLAFTSTDISVLEPAEDENDVDRWILLTPSVQLVDFDDDTDFEIPAGVTGVTLSKGENNLRLEGAGSLKVSLSNVTEVDGTIIARNAADLSDIDISAQTSIGFWIRASEAVVVNTFKIIVSEEADCGKGATYIETDVPALIADTWTFVRVTKTLTSVNAVKSIGLEVGSAGLAAATFDVWIDDLRGFKAFGGSLPPPAPVAPASDIGNCWSMAVITDEAEFSTYDSALVVSNGEDKIFYWEGASNSTFFSELSTDITSFSWVKEVSTLFDHFIIANIKKSTSYFARTILFADIGDCDNFEGDGTNGACVLTDGRGYIKRMLELLSDMIIYSSGSISYLRYVSGSQVFVPFTPIKNVGLFSRRAVWPYEGEHLFLGSNKKIYQYSGQRSLQQIGQQISKTLFKNLNTTYRELCVCGHDPVESRHFFFFPEGSDSQAKSYYSFDLDKQTQIWEYGKLSTDVRGMCDWISEGSFAGWRFNSQQIADVRANETTMRANDAVYRAGCSQAIFIDTNGYVYSFVPKDGSDNGSDIDAIFDTKDLTSLQKSEIFRVRITEIGFDASSGSSTSSTVSIYYSIDGGSNWVFLETKTIIEGWNNYTVSCDVEARKIRVRFRANHSLDYWMRGYVTFRAVDCERV